MRRIGLTGGIGSGKSTVAAILEELGARIISADKVGHEVYLPQTEGWRRVVEAFGEGILAADGSVDRRRLGAVVFADPAALERLNRILHPLIRAEIRRRLDAFASAGVSTPVVVEAAILVEASWASLVDEVWLVVADEAAVVERLRLQRGLAREEVEDRVRAQAGDAARRPRADVIIENRGSLADLRVAVEAAWRRLLKSSKPKDAGQARL